MYFNLNNFKDSCRFKFHQSIFITYKIIEFTIKITNFVRLFEIRENIKVENSFLGKIPQISIHAVFDKIHIFCLNF